MQISRGTTLEVSGNRDVKTLFPTRMRSHLSGLPRISTLLHCSLTAQAAEDGDGAAKAEARSPQVLAS